MEFQRGLCCLCSESSKVFTSSTAADFLKHLPQVLHESFLPESEFQKIKDSLKVCPICCYKLELASELKKMMLLKTNDSDLDDHCHFCKSNKCVIEVKDDWKFFVQRTEGFLKFTDFPVNVCYSCMFYFDTIYHFKTKLTYKFPKLLSKLHKPFKKEASTPKRKSLSNSPPSSKKRKIIDNCFTYLQPLCNDNYHVDRKVKTDAKMYKKIAYVDLNDVKEFNNETPKTRPKIRIKLKQRAKRTDREKLHKSATDVFENSKIGQPYVKLSKSEEVPRKINKDEQRRRSLSIERQEGPEEKIDETPKAACLNNLASKRRVSLYAELKEVEDENGSENEKGHENKDENEHVNKDAKENENKSDTHFEEINNIVEKYIKDTTFNDTNRLELLQEIEENNVENVVDKNETEKLVEENGIEEAARKNEDEKSVEKDEGEKLVEENKDKGPHEENENKKPENDLEKQGEENTEDDMWESLQLENTDEETTKKEQDGEKVNYPHKETHSSSSPESLKTPTKDDSGSEGSDLDVSDKCNDNLVKDSLNSSERKKKRVTFSDEISS